MDASFDINDFFPTTDPINPNARYSHADESFFPQLNTANAGSFQELTTDTNNKVTQIQELMKHKQDAQITEVVLPQESFISPSQAFLNPFLYTRYHEMLQKACERGFRHVIAFS